MSDDTYERFRAVGTVRQVLEAERRRFTFVRHGPQDYRSEANVVLHPGGVHYALQLGLLEEHEASDGRTVVRPTEKGRRVAGRSGLA